MRGSTSRPILPWPGQKLFRVPAPADRGAKRLAAKPKYVPKVIQNNGLDGSHWAGATQLVNEALGEPGHG